MIPIRRHSLVGFGRLAARSARVRRSAGGRRRAGHARLAAFRGAGRTPRVAAGALTFFGETFVNECSLND